VGIFTCDVGMSKRVTEIIIKDVGQTINGEIKEASSFLLRPLESLFYFFILEMKCKQLKTSNDYPKHKYLCAQ
jgi:hypothetical protein